MARCPGCNTPLTRVEEDQLRLQTCSNCFGTWIKQGMLGLVVRNPAVMVEAGEKPRIEDLAATVSESDTKGVLKCPECLCAMRKGRFHQLIPINIDQCPKCLGIWLDVGELPL